MCTRLPFSCPLDYTALSMSLGVYRWVVPESDDIRTSGAVELLNDVFPMYLSLHCALTLTRCFAHSNPPLHPSDFGRNLRFLASRISSLHSPECLCAEDKRRAERFVASGLTVLLFSLLPPAPLLGVEKGEVATLMRTGKETRGSHSTDLTPAKRLCTSSR